MCKFFLHHRSPHWHECTHTDNSFKCCGYKADTMHMCKRAVRVTKNDETFYKLPRKVR